jgi:V/A-type H+/Na+-transporting ATPase subunit A
MTESTPTDAGVVRRINGPLVEVELSGLVMSELLELGSTRLPAEVVALRGAHATAQAYEYTGGMAPGAPARRLRRPLSVRLGPGLTGRVFDGLLRPLEGAGAWLDGTSRVNDDDGQWTFRPSARTGTEVRAGDVLGVVTDAGPVEHRVLVPFGVGGRIDAVRPAGRCGGTDSVAVVAGVPVPLTHWWPVRQPRPAIDRLDLSVPLLTGQRVIDALYPVIKGATAAVPGGFGTGKTVLLQQLAKWCDADVIVYVACGERGNELADVVSELGSLTDPRTGGRLADRTVVIANTSNMPIMAREASVYTGATVAEFYRDMGHDAVVIADSTSRWAEALREFASRTGVLPAEEGYPANLASALAAFYERAGRVRTLGGEEGSITIVGAVSPPGGDMTEPVTSQTQRFVRTLWTLDRDLAYSRHYPAVTWNGSYCRDVAAVGAWHASHGDARWVQRRADMVALLTEADRLGALAELVGLTALPGQERMTILGGRLIREAVLQQSALSGMDAYSGPGKTAALVDAVLELTALARRLVEEGVPVSTVEEQDYTPVIRARETVGEDGDAVKAVAARLRSTLQGLG